MASKTVNKQAGKAREPAKGGRPAKENASPGKKTSKKKFAGRGGHLPRVPKVEKCEFVETTPEEQEEHIGPGRPMIPIDKDTFEGLCRLQCTKSEIAAWFGCNDETISNWCKRTYADADGNPMNYLDCYKKFSEHGKISLRRQMLQSVQKGNVTMQIFLAKNLLGMSDKSTVDVAASGGVQIYFPDNGRPDVLGD